MRKMSTRPILTIYVPRYLKEALIKLKEIKPDFSISQFVAKKLSELVSQHDIQMPVWDEPDLILLVRCPHCGGQFQTTSVKMVRCEYCGRVFRVYRKRARTRIVKILKGNKAILFKKLKVSEVV